MSASVGALERLRNSFIPVIYTLHQRMIIMIWLVLLTFHFLSKYWWYTIPLGTIVAYILLGIDSMSCEIEEPFGYDQNDFDLTRFCKGIVRDTQGKQLCIMITAVDNNFNAHNSAMLFFG